MVFFCSGYIHTILSNRMLWGIVFLQKEETIGDFFVIHRFCFLAQVFCIHSYWSLVDE